MNSAIRLYGTLGCVVTTDGQDRWLLSAYHVLVGRDRHAVSGELIYQPAPGGPEQPVAQTDQARAASSLDAAAACLLPGVASVPEILGLGIVRGTMAPQVGMRLAKSGIASGITEGEILNVVGARVEIEPISGMPSKYELSSVSDSGAVWIEQDSGLAVALHVAGNDSGRELAIASSIPEVLNALQLQIVA